MSGFTKGPWVKDGLHVFGAGGEKVIVSDGPAFGSASHFKSAKANSHLIMAAPDLHDALLEAIEMIERQVDFNDDGDGLMISRCRAALAKVRGEK